jgi:hypothetical protein
MTLHELVQETVKAIHDNLEADSSASRGRLPIQSRDAARQVLDRHQAELGTRLDHSYLMSQMVWMQDASKVMSNWRTFEDTSLVDFIGFAAEKEMGDEYVELVLAPLAERTSTALALEEQV